MLLAPYSVRGVLTGVGYRASDAGIQKQLDQWRLFFPMSQRRRSGDKEEGGDGTGKEEHGSGGSEEESVPPVVEVMIGK